jgi:phosphoglycolate phosphatase-like HAD superfamily hydrolase
MAAAVATPRGPVRLLLFDIDGTLLECGTQTKTLFAAALTEVFGTTGDIDRYSMAGRTDPQIVIELMSGAGIPRSEIDARLPAMRDLYLPRLEASLDRQGMHLLPGVVELLERLAPHPGSDLALLTGNWEAGARTKLSRFDLNRFFPFGAFGSDAVHRSDLPPIALARAERHLGRPIPPQEALILGDSIYDVLCARDNGLQVLAVATGRTSAAALAAAGADWVVPDLLAAAELLR